MRKSPFESGPIGDAASREALARIQDEVSSMKAMRTALRHVKKGLIYANDNKFKEAEACALQAIKYDQGILYSWHLLGIARDKLGDRAGALEAYERALALGPESPEIANDLGRLAYRMEMWPQAEALFRHSLALKPNAPEASNNLAALLRRESRPQEAIDVLRTALMAHPEEVILWVTLGTVLGDQGEYDQAATFYSEALRLRPNYGKALHNLASIMFGKGQEPEAIAQTFQAIPLAETPEDATMMRFAIGSMSLSRGDLTQGWQYYAARLEPTFNEPIHFLTDRPQWRPGTDIAGRHLMLYGEQGLGDEVLFANLLADVIADLGPTGRLTLAVTDRLAPFFQRSFPDVRIGSHITIAREGRAYRTAPFLKDWSDIDYWAPMAELLQTYRPTLQSFPHRPEGFMRTDPARVEHWRKTLSHLPGKKVGLLWTSLIMNAGRHLYFSPFEQWRPVLTTPGATFINLQYGDQSEALAFAKREFGVEIYQPPGINLRDDLEDVAALSAAMDLVLGVSNASFNLAAAVGAPSWLVTARRAWTQLGSDSYPWYSQVRVFSPTTTGDWTGVMAQVAAALGEYVEDGTRMAAAG